MNIPGVVALLVSVAVTCWISEYWGKKGNIAALLSRKLLHVVGVGSLAVSPLVIFNYNILTGVTAGFFILLFILVKKRLLVTDIYNRPSWGIALFPVSFLVLWLYWGKVSPLMVGLPMLVLTFADAGAAIAGSLLAKRRYNLSGDEKSILGSMVFAVITCLCLWILPPVWQGFTHAPDPTFNLLSNLPFTDKFIICLVIAIFAAIAEGATSGGWDNVTVPLSAAWLLALLPGFSKIEIIACLPVMLLFATFGLLAYRKGWLDAGGAVTAGLLGFVIWVGGGWASVVFIGLFFISGSLLGKLRPGKPAESDEKMGKPRDYLQVLCNGGVAGGCIVWYGIEPSDLPMLLFAISVAISTADTWSSELGTRFGSRVINIIGFKPLPAGVSGGISWVGTIAGLVGALFMGFAGWLLNFKQAGWIIFGGFLGMIMDSVLGSLLQVGYFVEGKWSDSPSPNGPDLPARGFKWMTNDLVNLFSNLIITLFLALIITILWKGG